MKERQKRTVHFSFDATPDEAVLIDQKMKAAGFTKRSQFFRTLVLNGFILKLDLPELKEATRLMGILSNNVNQIARRVNENGRIYDTEVDEIVQGQEELVQAIRQVYEQLHQLYDSL